jgi:hypothetical protein
MGFALPVLGQEDAAWQCADTVIFGRVDQGESFSASFAEGLVVRLEPEVFSANPQGWTLSVTPESDSLADYSFAATPPYRFWNARYLDTSYGVSAEAALSMSRRDFRYLVTASDHEIGLESVATVLWPGESSDAEVERARERLEELVTGDGTLWIEDGSSSSPDAANPLGLIEWMSFRIELCTPLGQG